MTIGELRKHIEYCDDNEPVLFVLDNSKGRTKFYLEFIGAYSTAGGRMTVLSFEKEKRKLIGATLVGE